MRQDSIANRCSLVGILLLLGIAIANAEAHKADVVVAADGSGDFKTVQEAIDAVTTNESTRTVIFIKPGTYKEKLNVPSDKKNLKLMGESYENTILTFDDYGGKTKDYASTRIRADDCSLPKRDVIDDRIIEEVRTGTATKGDKGFIENPNVAGGWPELKSLPAPADDDHDGMPDVWEDKAGLDSSDVSDAAQDKDNDGYTNIEEYINGTDPAGFVDYTKQENNVNTLK